MIPLAAPPVDFINTDIDRLFAVNIAEQHNALTNLISFRLGGCTLRGIGRRQQITSAHPGSLNFFLNVRRIIQIPPQHSGKNKNR